MDKAKTRMAKRLPQPLLDAQRRVDSAVIRGESKEIIEKLRNERDKLLADHMER